MLRSYFDTTMQLFELSNYTDRFYLLKEKISKSV